jgi:hypothetical protein
MRTQRWLVAAAVILCLLLTQSVFAGYDSAATKAVMKQNVKDIQELQKRAAAKDYFGTAEKFMDLAKAFKTLDQVTPPKGTKVQWQQNHDGLINAAFRGIGACGAGDDAGIKAAIGELIRYRNEGHKIFK